MARKKDTPQKAALREMMGNYLKENNVKVKDGTDVNSIMRDMMSIILEGVLDQEMDEELGYSRYDYRNKETDNSRNGHSQKTMHTSYGDMEIDIPRDRKGEFEPQIVKKYQNTVTQDMEEKIISMYAKGMTTNDIESHMRELYDIEISDSKTFGRYLCGCFHGCHPLPCAQRRSDCKTCGLYRHRDRHGRAQRCPWYVCRPKRKCEVLAFYSKWSEESWRKRYPDCLCSRSERFSPGD